MTTVGQVSSAIEAWAPLEWAEPWDRVGLVLGDPQQPLSVVLCCLDLTAAVLDEAVQHGAQLVVAFHPPFLEPPPRWRADEADSGLLWQAARAGLSVYATHTALDARRPGTSDWLAEALGLVETEPLTPSAVRSEACWGLGRVGQLKPSLSTGELTRRVQAACGAPVVRWLGAERAVSRIAVVGGSGGSLVSAAAAAGAEVLVTGDVRHHAALLAQRLGLGLIDPGHAATERWVVERTAAFLGAAWPALKVLCSSVTIEPLGWRQ